ncbi:MAG: hypothetical protein NTY38_03875, partial [Acidobacteria bacterium]|nr:hypothetical protein [Acidobacteriota bacterium]
MKCVTLIRVKNNMPASTLTPLMINAAIEGFEAQRERIDSQITELRAMLRGRPGRPATSPEAEPRRRKKFSAETIRRMAEGQRRRHAKVSGESEASTQTTSPTKAKRKLSAAGKAAIVAALKKRWAAKKAAAV